ncbi:hypothetical protein B0H13DRAFT_1861863 [Mycena leptocephala]|nr:hypothetical protein B0H13DRAFT_1861863 [Mycena leptocephala]
MPSTDGWKKSPKSSQARSLGPRIDAEVTDIDENCSLGLQVYPGTHKAQLEKDGCRGRGKSAVLSLLGCPENIFGPVERKRLLLSCNGMKRLGTGWFRTRIQCTTARNKNQETRFCGSASNLAWAVALAAHSDYGEEIKKMCTLQRGNSPAGGGFNSSPGHGIFCFGAEESCNTNFLGGVLINAFRPRKGTPQLEIQLLSRITIMTSDPSKVYEVDIETYTCDCLDYPLISYCKHISAVERLFNEGHEAAPHTPEVPRLASLPLEALFHLNPAPPWTIWYQSPR